jgi:hypothetical protein
MTGGAPKNKPSTRLEKSQIFLLRLIATSFSDFPIDPPGTVQRTKEAGLGSDTKLLCFPSAVVQIVFLVHAVIGKSTDD